MTFDWHKAPMAAFDIESTGVNPDTARIVTATLIEITADGAHVTEWLVDPGIPIPAGASAIHGITTQRAREEGQSPETAVFEITGRIALAMGRGTPLVGMNLAYDLTVLDRECRRQNVDTLDRRMAAVEPVIDVYVMDKQVDTYRKGKRNLTAMAEHYGVTLDDAHTSAADALAAARIAWKMADRYPELRIDPHSLHDLQVGWRRAQCASLQAYFERQGKPQTVNGDWPVQQLPQGWTAGQLDAVESSDVA